MITVYQPQIQVTLIKSIKRTGPATVNPAKGETVDLTPFLGDQGVVRTSKGVAGPTGAFSIVFPDKLFSKTGDTLYAYIEPMDMIEIRWARNPTGGTLPLAMRGFVAGIRREETMESDGTPQRHVVIEGQDMGRLFEIEQIYPQYAAFLNEPMLLTFQLQAATGIPVAVMGVSDFMATVVNDVLNKKVVPVMSQFIQHQVPSFAVKATVPDGAVAPQMCASYAGGPLWSFIETFVDRPFNEAFTIDGETGPTFVFRPVPYRNLKGNFIIDGATDPGTFDLDIVDIVTLNLGRSDSSIANIFYVPPGITTLDSNAAVNVAAIASGVPFDFTYANNRPELYGQRQMQVGSNLIPQSLTAPVNMMPPGMQPAASAGVAQWFTARIAQLDALNRDNGVWEGGTITAKGSELYTFGRYVQVTRGAMTFAAYVTQVDHAFTPFGSWTTTLTVERADSFLKRIVNPSLGILEGRQGPYDA